MNPYPVRIQELHAHLANVWNQRDEQATEVLLAAIIGTDSQLTRTRAPKIVIETDWLTRDTEKAWFQFGYPKDVLSVRHMSAARVLRRRDLTAMIRDWLDEDSLRPGLYIESEWRRPMPRHWHDRTIYAILMAESVRLRVAYPKGGMGLKTEDERAADRAELQRLTRRVLDGAYRPAQTPPMSPFGQPTGQPNSAKDGQHAPEGLFYWCELLQKLSWWLTDWESLTGNLAAIARNISLLYMDGRQPDWTASERVFRDSINYTTQTILSACLARTTMNPMTQLDKCADASPKAVLAECARLRREHVLVAKRARKGLPWRYQMQAYDWQRMADRSHSLLTAKPTGL